MLLLRAEGEMGRSPWLLAAALAALLAAGCNGAGEVQPLPTGTLRASFPPHGLADVIVVDAVDRLPLRSATLIAPDGSTTAASYVNAAPSPRFLGGQRVSPDPWNNTVIATASPVGTQVGGEIAAPTMQSEIQLLTTVSEASIPVPDPVAYRRDWARYRIRVEFGTAPDLETRTIAAPAPPEAAAPPPA
jgi:hypothetical protein